VDLSEDSVWGESFEMAATCCEDKDKARASSAASRRLYDLRVDSGLMGGNEKIFVSGFFKWKMVTHLDMSFLGVYLYGLRLDVPKIYMIRREQEMYSR